MILQGTELLFLDVLGMWFTILLNHSLVFVNGSQMEMNFFVQLQSLYLHLFDLLIWNLWGLFLLSHSNPVKMSYSKTQLYLWFVFLITEFVLEYYMEARMCACVCLFACLYRSLHIEQISRGHYFKSVDNVYWAVLDLTGTQSRQLDRQLESESTHLKILRVR